MAPASERQPGRERGARRGDAVQPARLDQAVEQRIRVDQVLAQPGTALTTGVALTVAAAPRAASVGAAGVIVAVTRWTGGVADAGVGTTGTIGVAEEAVDIWRVRGFRQYRHSAA